MAKYDWLVVGSGISGATFARRLHDAGKKVLVIDRRYSRGGNMADTPQKHLYGPHIFHTNDKRVWDWVSSFSRWRPYFHRVSSFADGQLVPMPVCCPTISRMFDESILRACLRRLTKLPAAPNTITALAASEDPLLSHVGNVLKEELFDGYGAKQWGKHAGELLPEVTDRVPVRLSYDTRYFTDRYQALPETSYNDFFSRLLSGVPVELATPFKLSMLGLAEKIYYTGSIDDIIDTGIIRRPPYRSVHFVEGPEPVGMSEPVINYPSNFDFTRSCNYDLLHGRKNRGVCVYEYPREFFEDGKEQPEPMYPIPSAAARALYENRRQEIVARHGDKFIFAGRLGSYRYLNMDQACLQALQHADNVLGVKE